MDYMILKNELLQPQYAGLSDNEAADLLNAPVHRSVKSTFITARSILAYTPNGADILDKLERAAGMVSAVKWAMKFIESDSGIDIGHPATRAQVDALVAAGGLTADEGESLKALGLQPTSRAELIGLPPVSINDVNYVRTDLYREEF